MIQVNNLASKEVMNTSGGIMIQLITPSSYGELADNLVEMHRLRHRVFKMRMEWEVETSGDMEIDDFDALRIPPLRAALFDGRERCRS